MDGLSFARFVQKAESQYNVRIFYHPDSIPEFNVRIENDTSVLFDILQKNLSPLGLKISKTSQNDYFISGTKLETTLPDDFFYHPEKIMVAYDTTSQVKERTNFLKTRKELVAKRVVIGDRKNGIKSRKAVVTGRVTSATDGAPIVNGNLYIEETERGTTTDENGNYSFTLPKGTFTLVVSSLESETEKYRLEILSNGTLNVSLVPKLFTLEEFVVSSDKDRNVRDAQTGFEKISIKTVNEIPVVLGERDIIKVALLLPGVQTVGEGASGFNVRGSPADQNQFYINRVPVYNSSHLFGFFSAFNPETVNDFKLYKGSIPVEYGGRLSSVFDITAKTGSFESFRASGGISPVTTRLMVEGPVIKDQSSYMIGLRSTYSNWILRSVKNLDLRNSKAYFGDGLANFAVKLNRSNEIRLFGYYSYDQANIAGLTENEYHNAGGAVTWNHYMRNDKSLEVSLIRGNFGYTDRNMEYDQFAYKLSYDLQHTEIKGGIIINPAASHTLTVGLNSVLYESHTGDYLPLNEASEVSEKKFEPEQGVESGVFVGDEWEINPNVMLSGGLRFNLFNYLGPKTIYTYQEGSPRRITGISDTLSFGNNERIKTYNGLDYRISARYILAENLSVKASYNRLHQYIFMLSNTIAISPTDSWKMADYNIQPMTGNQISGGIYGNVLADIFEVSLEGYYKKVNNLVEFKDGARMLANELPETEIVQGKLTAWGLEAMIKKPAGRLNGWINYTFSKATVLVDNKETGEQNNFGDPYPANYDKPHALNLVANYKISKRLSFSGNLVYATGRPVTYPTAIYYQNDIKLVNYSRRNEYRLPDYFRVDVSFNIEGNLKSKKFAHGSWNVSVYNLTARRNAYSVYFRSEEGNIKGYRLSIFGTAIFSVTYNLKLGNYNE